MGKTPDGTLFDTGAEGGDYVRGVKQGNEGLVICLSRPQPEKSGGRIVGPFRIIDAGVGKYAAGIRSVVESHGIDSDAVTFLELLRTMPDCSDATHIFNGNSLRKLTKDDSARFAR